MAVVAVVAVVAIAAVAIVVVTVVMAVVVAVVAVITEAEYMSADIVAAISESNGSSGSSDNRGRIHVS